MFNKKEWSKEYNKKNRTRLRENLRKWRAKNPQKSKEHYQNVKEYQIDYRKKNKDKIKKREKEHYNLNKERYKQRAKEWVKNNIQKRKKIAIKYYSKRRIQLMGNICSIGIPIEVQNKILQRDKVCVYCASQENFTIDHIIPITKQGKNNYNNLVLACYSCNCKKSNKDVFMWCKEQNIEVPIIVIDLLNKQKEQNKLVV